MNKLFAVGVTLLAISNYAILYPLFKKGSEKIPPFTAMTISMFVLFMVSLILSIVFEHSLQLKWTVDKTGVIFLVVAGAINVVAFWLELIGLKHLPIWQYTLLILLTPIISSIAAYFILGEAFGIKLFIGLVIMSLGLYIAVR